MNIFYPLCLLTIFAFILIIYPKLVIVKKAPITKDKVLSIYLIMVCSLYYLRNLTYFYHIALITCILSSLALFIFLYFSVQDYFMYKNSSLTRKFDFIDKMKGLEFEHYVAEILRKQGFKRVSVTKATGDFGVDIVCTAKKGKEKIAIQVKRYNSPLSGKAIQEVVAGARHYNATRAMVITNSTFTPKAKVLAKSNDCELIDRYLLKRWVYENENNAKKRNQKETSDNNIVENKSSAIAINPLISTAQYMNFDDVPFTPELDDPTANESESAQHSTVTDDVPEIIEIHDNEKSATEADIAPPISIDSIKIEEQVKDTIAECKTNDTAISNVDVITETSEILINEDNDEQEEVLIETDQENVDESDYNGVSNESVETVNENFFDDL